MVEKKSETEKVDKKAPKKTTKTKAVSKPAIKKVVKKSSAKSSAGKPVKKNKTIVEEKIEDNEVHYFDEDGGSNVSQDPVRDYLRQIGQVRMIDQKEEEDFAKRYEVGLYAQWKLDNENITDPQTIKDYNKLTADGYRCKEHLVEANLRLVVALARKYAGRGMQFQDLIQEGNNGLLRAADKYDYSTGFRFSTYATWWVRQAITRAMADQSRTIRIPVHMVEIINRMSKIEKQLAVEFGRQPNAEEIAEKMEITAEKVEEIKRYSKDPISLYATIDQDNDTQFQDLIEDKEAPDTIDRVSENFKKDALDRVLGTLTDTERAVIEMRYGIFSGQPMTLDQVGRRLDYTRENVRLIELKAIAKLKHPSRAQLLRDYLNDAS